MRIVTSKLYRAFPELDHLTDEQCERLIRRVRNQRFNAWKTACMSIVAVVATTVAAIVLVFLMGSMLGDWLEKTDLRQTIAAWISIIAIIGWPAFMGLITRDVYLRHGLMIALNDYIERVRCLKCQYILIGLPAEAGRVTCSECGHMMTLDSLGASEQDLIPPAEGDTSAQRFR